MTRSNPHQAALRLPLLPLPLVMAAVCSCVDAQGSCIAANGSGEVFELSLVDGTARQLSGMTLFTPNGLALHAASGSVVYAPQTGAGNLAIYDFATGTNTNLGATGFNGPIYCGSIWPGGNGIPAGYYTIVNGTDDLWRVDIDYATPAILGATKVADIGGSYGFGDIAFRPDGLLYVSGTIGTWHTYDIVNSALTAIPNSPVAGGQVSFGTDGLLYVTGGGVLYQVDPLTGQEIGTVSSTASLNGTSAFDLTNGIERVLPIARWHTSGCAGSLDVDISGAVALGGTVQLSATGTTGIPLCLAGFPPINQALPSVSGCNDCWIVGPAPGIGQLFSGGSLTVPIPNDSMLLGQTLDLQTCELLPANANCQLLGLPFHLSDIVRCVIG